MELLDIYDLNRKKTGRTFVRGTTLNKGEYRLVIHICIFNSKNQMLIQKRVKTKDVDPGMWDVTLGGTATSGDDTHSTATRELKEELGLDYDFTNVLPHLTINLSNGFDDYYLLEMDIDEKQLKLQEEEVECVKWATKEEIHQMIDDKTFICYHHQFIDLIFTMKSNYGVYGVDRIYKQFKQIQKSDLPQAVEVIRKSFIPVTREFNITKTNCPNHTSFMTVERLESLFSDNSFMYGYYLQGNLIGFAALIKKTEQNFELNFVSVLPEYQHCGYGRQLVEYCIVKAKQLNATKICIGIIEQNLQVKNFYQKLGFVHTGTKKFEHLPFLVGFMEYTL